MNQGKKVIAICTADIDEKHHSKGVYYVASELIRNGYQVTIYASASNLFWMNDGDFWSGPTLAVMEEFMNPAKVPPEAIICANDTMAIAACDYLHLHKFNVPKDIVVSGFDGIEEADIHSPSVTTCARNERSEAKRIVKLIMQVLDGVDVPKHEELNYHIQLAQSCGCQESHLFDATKQISQINTCLYQHYSDIKQYSDMAEEILGCAKKEQCINILQENMFDNSFICLKADLEVMRADAGEQTLEALIKRDGVFSCDKVMLKDIVPQVEQKYMENEAVVIMPIHFNQTIIGYMGFWQNLLHQMDMKRLTHFLRTLDNSIGYLLATKEFE